MEIRITFNSALARYTGNKNAVIELPENACYEDLLAEIGRRYGPKLSHFIWDEAQTGFTHHVLAMTGFKNLTDLKHPLRHGEEIKFFLIIAGG